MRQTKYGSEAVSARSLERARLLSAAALRFGGAACASLTLFGANPARITAAMGMDGCTRQGYNYSGEIGTQPVSAVSATISETAEPEVAGGHVNGWAGVNNLAITEWLQAGIEQTPNQPGSHIYYESKIPGEPSRFVELGAVGINQTVKVEIKEDVRNPNRWLLYINGREIPTGFILPGSQSQLIPQITGESLEGQNNTCNTFQFRFDQIKLFDSHSRISHQKFTKTTDSAYRMRQVSADGFTGGNIGK